MEIAYFDAFAGISGDMVLGALIDVGMPLDYLRDELTKLSISNYEITAKAVEKNSIKATKVSIHAEEKGIVRTWPNVKAIIKSSNLGDEIKKKSEEIFLKLARAESEIHRKDIDKVHFHEVGATDSIIDIIGTVIGITYLKVKKVFASEIATGMGVVRTAHGMLPIPSPATLEILKNVPVYSGNVSGAELTTPTGAAIIKTYASEFGVLPPVKVGKVGYGAGTKDLDIPNVLRLITGNLIEKKTQKATRKILLIETNIDDISPEIMPYVMERLFKAGALDVWLTPIVMKKNRLATKLAAIVTNEKKDEIAGIILKETSSIGLRISSIDRIETKRKNVKIKTSFGEISVKLAYQDEELVNVAPEFDDCARLAKKKNISVKKVCQEALRKALEKYSKSLS